MIWLVGISRVFLFQHFIVDVIAGILLAFTSVYVSELIIHHVFSKSTLQHVPPKGSALENL
jgi:membrane-associated phospholipid phosphatase